VASKATDLVLVYKVCCLDGINIIIVVMDEGEEGLEIADKVKWKTKPSGFVSEFCNTLFEVLGVGISHRLRWVTLAVGNVVVDGFLDAKLVETEIADISLTVMLCSACNET